jgi:phage shock protein PspC (stress-responsive transcriptional regulator)
VLDHRSSTSAKGLIMNYPNPQRRRLQRSRNDRWIGGVCGGLAEYLNMDATLVRVLVVLLAVVTAAMPVIAVYLLMMLLLPEAPATTPGSIGPRTGSQWGQSYGPYGQSYGQQGWTRQQGWSQGPNWHQQPEDPVWGQAGPPWQQGNPTPPPPPRQSTEDLFSRAKHPTRPSSPSTGTPGSTPGSASGGNAGNLSDQPPAADDQPPTDPRPDGPQGA